MFKQKIELNGNYTYSKDYYTYLLFEGRILFVVKNPGCTAVAKKMCAEYLGIEDNGIFRFEQIKELHTEYNGHCKILESFNLIIK